MRYLSLIERGIIPDWLLRTGIRWRLEKSVRTLLAPPVEERMAQKQAFINELRDGPIAVHPDAANEQHYELPPSFFEIVLGPRLKYSSCYWPEGVRTLADAEDAMLALTCERARLEDGQTILELGCGWGSLTLWIAERYPNSQITALSNSATQRQFIEAQCAARGLSNVQVVTANVADFDTPQRFDRVLSVEMFEHMKNYAALLVKIAEWLRPEGLLFVHHFSHRNTTYHFDHTLDNAWLARHFFTGGTMPADDLLLYFQDDLKIVDHWCVSGTHYERTLNAWLDRMDTHRTMIEPILAEVYGEDAVRRWWVYWRLFFIICAESFGLRNGNEFLVTHLLFAKPDTAQ